MIKPFLILSLILTSSVIFAQERFYYLYDGWSILKILNINNEYLSFGNIGHPTTDASNPCFNFVQQDGTLITSIEHLDTTDGYGFPGKRPCLLQSDTLYIVGSEVDYSKSYTLKRKLLVFETTNMTLQRVVDYSNIYSGLGYMYIIDTTENGFVFAVNYSYDATNSYLLLLKTNQSGDTLATKTYNFFPTNSTRRRVFPTQLLKLPDGGYILSCEDEIGQYMYQQQRAWFLRLDSQGNELWRRATSTQDTMCYRPFAFLTQNNDYIITWSDPFLYEEVVNPSLTIWLARMSDNGIISNRHKISDDIAGFPIKMFYVNDYHQDSYGNIFIMGEMTYPYNGFLIKINPQGNAVWFREYECFPENDAEGDWTKLYGLTPTPDGGFIMGGEYMSPNSTMFPGGIQKGLAIKVDSCGCLEENCNPLCNVSIDQQFINAQNAQIYPNPATDLVNLELVTFAKTVNVQVFDAEGCLWINTIENSELSNPVKLSLDVSGLAAGYYSVNIWADGKLFTGKFVKVRE